MVPSAKNSIGISNRLFDAIPDMLILYDRNATIIDIRNPDADLMADGAMRPIGELTGQFRERFQSVFDTRHTCQFLYSHGMPDGQTKVYDAFLAYVNDGCLLAGLHHVSGPAVARIESEHLHRFFAEVLDNVAIPVSVKNMDTERYVYWSHKAEMFGRSVGEMIGGTENLYMPPAQARAVQELDRRLAEGTDERYQGTEKYTTTDGREHTFVVTRTPFTFGTEKLILNSALDVSELNETKISLVNAKNELANRNMILTSVLSLADVVPWGCDLEEGIFYCDYNTYHPENAPRPDSQGRYVIPMSRYFASIHPDHRQDAVRMLSELAEGERQEVRETYLVHWYNDREWEWVQIQSSVSGRAPDGRPTRLIGSAQRVTEQKRTELELRQAKEELYIKNVTLSSVLGIAQVIPWYGDLKKGVFSCNYSDYHHEEAASPDENGAYTLPFDRFFTRIHPDYRQHAIDQFADLLAGRISEFHEIYPIYWYDDREYEWVETQSSIPTYGPDGDPLQLVGSARVITPQKRMEESLRIAKEQAEQSDMLKSAFVANMSHEIRTPLNAIVGFSELISEAETAEEKQEYLTIIQNSNAMLLQLINDILDLSKIEAGTLEFSFADHDLNALMAELEQTARIKVTNGAVEVACTSPIPECTIHTDRGRLMQVMHNFINNAAKFTCRGHIHFGVRKQPDGRWYFYVEDTGAGIAADKVESVFERFVKLDSKAKGTGLGLAISKSIVERLGGEIGVSSVEGQGSTFWFVLPAGCIATSALSVAAPETITENAACGESGQRTILIAEDDPANYKLFEAMLRRHYTLQHAWNGREAVEMFREHRPDMILMDIKMPEMDGYQATAAIRKLSANIPIVAVTAYASPDDMRRILAEGFNGFLPKPVNSQSLKEKISELCCHNEDGER